MRISRNARRNAALTTKNAIRSTYRSTRNIADAAFTNWLNWSSTDHSRTADFLNDLPTGLGFWFTVRQIITHFIYTVIAALFLGIVYAVFFVYLLPHLLIFAVKALFGQL